MCSGGVVSRGGGGSGRAGGTARETKKEHVLCVSVSTHT